MKRRNITKKKRVSTKKTRKTGRRKMRQKGGVPHAEQIALELKRKEIIAERNELIAKNEALGRKFIERYGKTQKAYDSLMLDEEYKYLMLEMDFFNDRYTKCPVNKNWDFGFDYSKERIQECAPEYPCLHNDECYSVGEAEIRNIPKHKRKYAHESPGKPMVKKEARRVGFPEENVTAFAHVERTRPPPLEVNELGEMFRGLSFRDSEPGPFESGYLNQPAPSKSSLKTVKRRHSRSPSPSPERSSLWAKKR